MPLHQHRVAELGADLAAARAAIAACDPVSRHDSPCRDHRPGCQISRHHRVVNPFSGERVDEPAGIAGEQHAPTAGPPQRSADGDHEGREIAPHRFAGDDAARPQFIDKSPLQLVRRGLNGVAVVGQHVADADVDVIAFRKDVGVTFGCASGRTRRSAPADIVGVRAGGRVSIGNPQR